MSQLDEFIDNIERCEKDKEMYFSLYSIPSYYLKEEPAYDSRNED